MALVGSAGGNTSGSGGLDLTNLKLGDGHTTTSGPRRGYVYACQQFNGSSPVTGPWISGERWDMTAKPTVDGEVEWPNARVSVKRVGKERLLSGNGLPSHATGKFPVQQSDDAARYDPNPNSIGEHEYSIELPAQPRKASHASCANMGPVGVLDSGVALYNAVDATGDDAAAHEIQDSCGGHPDRSSTYHYHALPSCLDTGPEDHSSKRIGWALDGFPIYGPRGKGGKYLRDSDLDACHGTTSKVKIGGKRKRIYHYVATDEFPYTIGCYRGTPVT